MSAQEFRRPLSNFEKHLSGGSIVVNPPVKVDDVQALLRPHLEKHMHPAPKIGLSAGSSPQHRSPEARKHRKPAFAPP
eukprot:6323809-Amphidinium_carterae.3